MNKIYTLLSIFLLVILVSCKNEVFIDKPIPLSDRTLITSPPDYIFGTYVRGKCSQSKSYFNLFDEIIISKQSESSNNVRIILHSDEENKNLEFIYDFSKNILHTQSSNFISVHFGNPIGVFSDFNEKKLKIFEQDGKIYVNCPTDSDEWRFLVFEQIRDNAVNITISEFNPAQFEKNKGFYKHNDNYKYDYCLDEEKNDKCSLKLELVDWEQFNEFLTDKLLMSSCIFVRK